MSRRPLLSGFTFLPAGGTMAVVVSLSMIGQGTLPRQHLAGFWGILHGAGLGAE